MDAARRQDILGIVAQLRVCDIRDGLDWVGMHHIGSVDSDIRPLWRTKAAGFARTYRHVPTQRRIPELSPEDYTKWAFEYWSRQLWDVSALRQSVSESDFLVVDTMGQKTPAVGSLDSMIWSALGVKGVLTNGGTRDTDEQLLQKALPCWYRWIVQPMYQGRVEFGDHDAVVEIGGVAIRPGDLVVADGDGAIAVPADLIDDVLKYAVQEAENDRAGRSALYDVLGLPPDESLVRAFDTPPHPYAKSAAEMARRLARKSSE
ncbi:RraA family protein [Pelagibacterium mangrovi]|uniref:RraA family protein n=1 Tax=Pelagibacterium mangrovi TaxID=3119828 RepID=UPI002FC9F869